jgi:hypothetical protein
VLQIKITKAEAFNEVTSTFIDAVDVVLNLEHSLVSLSKWESKWEIPFLASQRKTDEQTLDYISMMNLGANFPPGLFAHFSNENYREIDAYIDAKMTATTFSEQKKTPSMETITSELIYYWMTAFTIPFECQYWHLNRLLALIKVCNEKNAPPKKMSRAEVIAQNRRLNDQRRREMGSKG